MGIKAKGSYRMTNKISEILTRYRIANHDGLAEELNNLFMSTLTELLIKYTEELLHEKS